MPKDSQKTSVEELLRDLIIIELLNSGATQSEVQKFSSVSINRVNSIAKLLKKRKAE